MATFLSPQDETYYAHRKTLARLEMNLQFLKTVRDKCPKTSADFKKLNSILDNAMDRQVVTDNEMNYASGVYAKVG